MPKNYFEFNRMTAQIFVFIEIFSWLVNRDQERCLMKETGDEKSRDNVPFKNKFSSDISVAPYTVDPPTKFRGFPTGMSSPAAP
jgi:hypothetical protein